MLTDFWLKLVCSVLDDLATKYDNIFQVYL